MVLAAIVGATTINIEIVPFRRSGLVGTPFLLISIVAALYGDYYAGALSVILSSIIVSFINNTGLHFAVYSLIRSIEFFIASSVIYYLAWRSRDLTKDSATLIHTISKLESIANKQSKEASVNKRNLEKLRQINNQLQSIVDAVMKDKNMWLDSVKKDISQIESKKAKSKD